MAKKGEEFLDNLLSRSKAKTPSNMVPETNVSDIPKQDIEVQANEQLKEDIKKPQSAMKQRRRAEGNSKFADKTYTVHSFSIEKDDLNYIFDFVDDQKLRGKIDFTQKEALTEALNLLRKKHPAKDFLSRS